MNDRPNPQKQPNLSAKGLSEAEERKRRQAEALRANLHRRKAQDRARDADDKDDTGK